MRRTVLFASIAFVLLTTVPQAFADGSIGTYFVRMLQDEALARQRAQHEYERSYQQLAHARKNYRAIVPNDRVEETDASLAAKTGLSVMEQQESESGFRFSEGFLLFFIILIPLAAGFFLGIWSKTYISKSSPVRRSTTPI